MGSKSFLHFSVFDAYVNPISKVGKLFDFSDFFVDKSGQGEKKFNSVIGWDTNVGYYFMPIRITKKSRRASSFSQVSLGHMINGSISTIKSSFDLSKFLFFYRISI